MNAVLLVAWTCAAITLGIAIEWTRHHHTSPAAVVIAALILLLTADRLYRRWVLTAHGGPDLGRHAGSRKPRRKAKAIASAEQTAITAPTALKELTV